MQKNFKKKFHRKGVNNILCTVEGKVVKGNRRRRCHFYQANHDIQEVFYQLTKCIECTIHRHIRVVCLLRL